MQSKNNFKIQILINVGTGQGGALDSPVLSGSRVAGARLGEPHDRASSDHDRDRHQGDSLLHFESGWQSVTMSLLPDLKSGEGSESLARAYYKIIISKSEAFKLLRVTSVGRDCRIEPLMHVEPGFATSRNIMTIFQVGGNFALLGQVLSHDT